MNEFRIQFHSQYGLSFLLSFRVVAVENTNQLKDALRMRLVFIVTGVKN